MKKLPYQALVFIAWLGAMTWLVWFKVLPAFIGGDAPGYADEIANAETAVDVCWKVHWNDEFVGYAISRPLQLNDDETELRGVVALRDLPVKEMSQKLLGPLAAVVPFGNDMKINLTIANRMRFREQSEVQNFDTSVSMAGMPRLIRIHGERIENNQIEIAAKLSASGGEATELVRETIQIPRGESLDNGLAPRTRMLDLKIGQSWTIPVYRPFPPNSPVEIMQARVERYELIHSRGEAINAKRVAYRNQAGTGIGAAREPVAIIWVDDNGVVVQQEITISGLVFKFTLARDDEQAEQAAQLEDATFGGFFAD